MARKTTNSRDVIRLRKISGLSMIESKRALDAAGGDFEKALRQVQKKILDARGTLNPLDIIDEGHIYLDTNDNRIITNLNIRIVILADELGYDLEFADQKRGSFISTLILKVKAFFSKEDVQKRIDEAIHAYKIHLIDKTQSEIDNNLAQAVSALLSSAKEIDNMVVQLGSLIIIKYMGENNKPITLIKALSTEEMIELRKHPESLDSPKQALSILEAVKQSVSRRISEN